MAIALIAIVIALVLGHAAPGFAAAVRDFTWHARWLRWLDARFHQGSVWRGRWGVVLALAPALLLVGVLQAVLYAPLLGLGGLLLAIAVLFYSWGPRDLDRDVQAILDAPDAAARREAAAQLWPDPRQASIEAPALVTAVFHAARRRWFGVLFWFLLLGPFGALLYRLVVLETEGEDSGLLPLDTLEGARALRAVLDWPVSQLVTLAMALAGDFDTVVAAWKSRGGAGIDLDADFLGAAGRASVRAEVAEEVRDYLEEGVAGGELAVQMGALPELRDAMSLAWRILLLWLAVVALLVLAGWVA